MRLRPINLARLLGLVVPLALLAGAWGFQLIGGLTPCEMCHWQRAPLYVAVPLSLFGIAARGRPSLSRGFLLLVGLCLLVSGLIGAFHAGVEYHWWQGPTHCTSAAALGAGDPLKAILAAPIVRCDIAQWRLFGISLAGWNALISIPIGILIQRLCLTNR